MKTQRMILAVIACLFLLFFADAVRIEWSWFRRNSEYATAAQLAAAAVHSEETLNDGFKLRYICYEIAGLFNRGIGRRNVDNVYRLPTGHLVSVGERVDVAESAAGMKEFQDFCSAKEIPLLYVNLPVNIIRSEDLAMFGVTDQSGVRADRLLEELEAAGIDTLDMRPYIMSHFEDPCDAFYKTDHHWKISTGLFCAQILSEQLRNRYGLDLDLDAISDEAFSVTLMKNSWVGERGKKTGSIYSGLDDFELIKPIAETHFHLTIPKRNLDTTGSFSILLDEKRYETGFWGRRYGPSFYYSYLFGNDPIQIIQNEDHDKGKILIVKDSFAQAVNPFLAMTAGTLVSWDLRHNEKSLQEYIEENDFDVVVVMYCESMINRNRETRFMFDFT